MSIVWTSVNKHYQVVVLPESDKENYGIQNILTQCMEYKTESMPQAVATAEQYDYMIQNDTWKDLLNQMFGDEYEFEFNS